MSDEKKIDAEFETSGFEASEFETRLTHAMQRVDAPEGFAARIMDRAAKRAAAGMSGPGKVIAFRSRVQRYAGLALAAMLALGVFGIDQIHQRHEREIATQQFETASRITDQALEHTRQELAKAGVKLDSTE
jgi:hypothetical protein